MLPLEHWVIDEASITRWCDGSEVPLDAQELVVELQDALSIPEDLISTYLEELASTLAGAAFKLEDARAGRRPDARTLADADFQTTEAAMTEGHPGSSRTTAASDSASATSAHGHRRTANSIASNGWR